ncbi:MAG: branched-chain amino acid aminotransferase [Lactobacillus sp.]|jgi:branched-chain amino acid aminotransferase|nr:branched-chain amino acid aminotransferase [Lactobacillus sp.]MCI2033053.1 branched-chain amino acid aminotransferase [Lactobacillus sp.]
MTVNIDWNNLGFEYMNLPYRYISHWQDGQWDDGKLTDNNMLTINESSPILHYGQGAFEGLKAYRTKDGHVQLFRVDRNAKRMQDSADKLLMPQVPIDKFINAAKQVAKANEDYVPPYGTGATLYLRPILIGVGENIGVSPAKEYLFTIFAMPVGPYFKGGMAPTKFIVADNFDRAAHFGTGGAKVGGNYAASLQAGKYAHEHGYGDAIYLDPIHHEYLEEVGSANFFGITKDGKRLLTPKSPSILPSVTKYSILDLAKERFGLETEETQISIHDLDQFSEAGACGTAAVITPIQSITYGDDEHTFGDGSIGPLTQKIYDELIGIQFGDVKAPEGWIFPVD